MKRTILVMVLSALAGLSGLAHSGCGQGSEQGEAADTPTSGNITISVDETFAPIMDSEIRSFESIYTNASINVRYKPEAEVINDLLADSVKLVIVTRKLNKEEREYFEKLALTPTQVKICYDAIAVIVNNSNRDTLMAYDKLEQILSGQISSWKQLNPASSLGPIQVIFDNANSSTVRHIKEKTNGQLAKNSFAVKTNSAVIEYVSKNRNALGVIGVNWISDKDDTTSLSFLRKVRVVGFKSNMPKADPEEYYQPFQAYIAQQFYPLIREVYMINRDARAGLPSGFIAFVTHEKGQRIILKSGLVPANAPIRLVELKREDILSNSK